MDVGKVNPRTAVLTSTSSFLRSLICGVVVSIVVITLPLPLRPADANEPSKFLVIDQPLADVLRDLARHNGTTVAISDSVSERVRNRQWDGNADRVVQALVDEYGLHSYNDGLALHVTTASEAESAFIVLSKISAADLTQRLKQLDIYDCRYQLRATPDGSVVRASGPPRFVGLVRQTTAAPEQSRPPQLAAKPRAVASRAEPQTVEVFRGRSRRRAKR